jgi:hypothetical protein
LDRHVRLKGFCQNFLKHVPEESAKISSKDWFIYKKGSKPIDIAIADKNTEMIKLLEEIFK